MASRITIITPSLNGGRHVAEAIRSLSRQGCSDLEHLFLDAGSTDETIGALAGFPATTLIREPDRGSHDAMNKGVARASGEIIGFLNTDDFYPDQTLAAVAALFGEDPALDMVAGASVVFREREDGRRVVIVARDHARENGLWPPELAFGAPGLNGRFFRRRVFDRIGGFEVGHYFGGDRHFLIRAALAGVKSRPLGRVSIIYRSHDRSATYNAAQRNAARFALENLQMAREFLSRPSLAGDWRRLLLAWHAFEMLRLALRGASQLGPGTLAPALGEAWRFDPLWFRHLGRAFRYRAAVRRSERRAALGAEPPL